MYAASCSRVPSCANRYDFATRQRDWGTATDSESVTFDRSNAAAGTTAAETLHARDTSSGHDSNGGSGSAVQAPHTAYHNGVTEPASSKAVTSSAADTRDSGATTIAASDVPASGCSSYTTRPTGATTMTGDNVTSTGATSAGAIDSDEDDLAVSIVTAR